MARDDRDMFERAGEDKKGTLPNGSHALHSDPETREGPPKGRGGTAPSLGEVESSPAHSSVSPPSTEGKKRKMKRRDRTGRLTRAVGCCLLKPLDATSWEEAGDHLQDLSDYVFRAMNVAITDCLINDRTQGGEVPQSLTYRSVSRFAETNRQYWASRSTADWKDDDQGYKENQEARRLRRSQLSVPSTIRVAISKTAADKFVVWRKGAGRGESAMPTFRRGHPIIWSTGWSLQRDDKGYVLELKTCRGFDLCKKSLEAARAKKRDAKTRGAKKHDVHEAGKQRDQCRCPGFRFALRVDGPGAHKQFRLMTSGDPSIRLGNCQVFRDERKNDWQVRITYDAPRPVAAAVDPKKVLVVHRGMREFLTLATGDVVTTADELPQMRGWIHARATGLSHWIAAVKNQFHKRKRGLQKKKRALGKGARGHGWWARCQTYRELEDTEDRFIGTVCKQIAAAVVAFALFKGCGRIVLDDWSSRQAAWEADKSGQAYLAMLVRRWPFARLRAAIVWAAEKAGLEVTSVDAGYLSQTCPKCGNIDAGNDRGNGRFECTRIECALFYGVDAIAAWNMAIAAGAPGAFEAYDAKLCEAVKKMTARAKPKKKEKANAASAVQ